MFSSVSRLLALAGRRRCSRSRTAATCSTPPRTAAPSASAGPSRTSSREPSRIELYAVGHQALVRDGETWIADRAWEPSFERRQLWLDRVRWGDGRPVVDGPTCDERPTPR